MNELIELLRPIVGDSADELVRGLASHIRGSEGGVRGFFQRVKSAGFSSSLESWKAGKPTQVSPALVANLFGAGSMGVLASECQVSIEKATDAAAIALPHLVFALAPEASRRQFVANDTAQNTSDRPPVVWALMALALTGFAIWAASTLGQPQSKNLNEMVPITSHEPEEPRLGESEVTITEKETHSDVTHRVFEYRGRVPKDRVSSLAEQLTTALGEESSGFLSGADTKPEPWLDHLGHLASILSQPQNFVNLVAKGSRLTFEGQSTDPAALESLVRDMFRGTEIELDFSQVTSVETTPPSHSGH